MHVHAAQFDTAGGLRYSLAGIKQAGRVEGILDALELRQLRGAELRAHLIQFLDTDTMFSGNRAPCADAQLQDPAAEPLGTLALVLLVGVIKNQWMEVAVAGVKDVGDSQPIFV